MACVVAGAAGVKRHWRYLLARYGAYPTVWIIGGEASGPEWTEVARYVQKNDPHRRPATMHPGDSGRKAVTDESVISFDMLQTGHGDWSAAVQAIPKLKAAYARMPAMPAMVGEYCYEGHMQTAFQDVQRYVFWGLPAQWGGRPDLWRGRGLARQCRGGSRHHAGLMILTTSEGGNELPRLDPTGAGQEITRTIPLGAL